MVAPLCTGRSLLLRFPQIVALSARGLSPSSLDDSCTWRIQSSIFSSACRSPCISRLALRQASGSVRRAQAAELDHAGEQDADGQPMGYRQNVGVCLVNRDGLVFAARRIDDSSSTWQMPQGGIDEGEEPAAAAVRELREETGVATARIVAASSDWLQYDFPAEVLAIIRKDGRRSHRGQRQKWFLFFFEGEDTEVNLDQPEPEFSEYKWVDIQEMPLHVIAFKREVYEAVVADFAPLISAHLKGGQWVGNGAKL